MQFLSGGLQFPSKNYDKLITPTDRVMCRVNFKIVSLNVVCQLIDFFKSWYRKLAGSFAGSGFDQGKMLPANVSDSFKLRIFGLYKSKEFIYNWFLVHHV